MRSYLNALSGNDSVRMRLGALVERDAVPHAFLIEGRLGSGKHTLARELAAALNCENIGDPASSLPCHRCNSCRRIAEGSFTDVKYLKRQKDKATIGVDEVRLFKEDMYLSATESKYKIYVFENAELMTPQAQNALLIALEEPPRDVVIILLCEQADKLLTTIKSRVQHISTSHFSTDELDRYVTERSETARALKHGDYGRYRGLLLAAEGSIGRALELLSPEASEENAQMRRTVEAILGRMTARAPYSELYAALSELSTKRCELSAELECLLLALRDIISRKTRSGAEPLFFTSDEELDALTREFDAKRPYKLFEIVCDAYASNQKNANIATLITELATRISSCR